MICKKPQAEKKNQDRIKTTMKKINIEEKLCSQKEVSAKRV